MRRRASGLIVSAGIGVAVLSGWGCGVAAADPTETDGARSDSTASEDASAAPGQESTRRDATTETASQAERLDTEKDTVTESDGESMEATQEDLPDEPVARGSRPSERSATSSNSSDTPDVEAASDTGEPEVEVEPEAVAVAVPDSIDAAPLDPFSTSDDAPGAPVEAPAAWALLGAARREIGVLAPDSTVSPTAQPVANSLTVTSADPLPADWESQYTGEPTLIHQLVVVGLRVVDLVLKPFGGLLAFTGLKVPLLTDGVPPFFLTHGLDVKRTEFDAVPVWTLQPKTPSDKYIVALHGGAYVAEATLFHWSTYTDMARDTGATVIVPLYPLVPDGGTAAVAVPKTANFIEQLIAEHGANNVSVIGDSAGGGLALAAVQELVHRGSAVPSRMVLFAPWLDATLSDPLSAQLDPGDPLLDVPNLQQAGRDWAGELGPEHRFASPLNGSLEGLPPTAVYSGSLDLLTPDTLRLQQRITEGGFTNFTFNLRRDLIHDWGIFAFLPEAHAVRPPVYEDLLG